MKPDDLAPESADRRSILVTQAPDYQCNHASMALGLQDLKPIRKLDSDGSRNPKSLLKVTLALIDCYRRHMGTISVP